MRKANAVLVAAITVAIAIYSPTAWAKDVKSPSGSKIFKYTATGEHLKEGSVSIRSGGSQPKGAGAAAGSAKTSR